MIQEIDKYYAATNRSPDVEKDTVAKNFLKSQSPLPALTWNADLSAVCKVHTDDLIRTKGFSHTGSDGSSPSSRATKYGDGYKIISENLAGGYSIPLHTVVRWILSPGHRDNIFRSNVAQMGSYTGRSQTHMDITTQMFVDNYQLKSQAQKDAEAAVIQTKYNALVNGPVSKLPTKPWNANYRDCVATNFKEHSLNGNIAMFHID